MKTPLGSTRAVTIVELMIAVTIGVIALGAVYTGAMSMQRCFAASQSFLDDSREQSRLSDYLSMDVRRADKVTVGGANGVMLTATMQDYYDSNGQPRTPTITKYVHSYGDPTAPMVVKYIRTGQFIYRQERSDPPMQIAADVQDVQVNLLDGGRSVETTVTFLPKFRRSGAVSSASTTLRTTTMVRNYKRPTP